MHDFDLEPRAIPLSRTDASPDPVQVTERSDAGASRPPAAIHSEASLLHLQRTIGNTGVVQLLAEERDEAAEPSPVHDVVGKQAGSALDDATRGDMEARFGQDFSDVRIHTDAEASASAEAVAANAYTVGNDIVFRSGHFDTATPTGQRTIAHELSHVVQQRSGPVDGTDAPGGIRLSDPSDRFERAAEASADDVMSAESPTVASAGGRAAVQRDTPDQEDETAQRVIQRELTDEEDREDDDLGGA